MLGRAARFVTAAYRPFHYAAGVGAVWWFDTVYTFDPEVWMLRRECKRVMEKHDDKLGRLERVHRRLVRHWVITDAARCALNPEVENETSDIAFTMRNPDTGETKEVKGSAEILKGMCEMVGTGGCWEVKGERK